MQLDIVVESKIGPEAFRELGLLAEHYGFRAIWVQNYARAPDPFMTAVPLAMAATRIRVGVVAVSAYELHPLKLANAVLTLNSLCAGGAAVVVGGGGEWPGVMKMDTHRRITITREAIEILKAAATGRVVNYAGKVFTSRGYIAHWSKQPPPQIYAGSTGPQMIRMGVAAADGLMMSDIQPAMFDWPMPVLQAALETRDPALPPFGISNFVAWHVKADAEASYAEARRELMIRGWLERRWVEPFLGPEATDLVLANTRPFLNAFRERHGNIEGVKPELVQKLVDGLTCSGGPDSLQQHIEHLQQFQAAGFTEIALGLQDDPAAAVRMIGEQVLPALR